MWSSCQLGFIGIYLELDICSTLRKARMFLAEPTCICSTLRYILLSRLLFPPDIGLLLLRIAKPIDYLFSLGYFLVKLAIYNLVCGQVRFKLFVSTCSETRLIGLWQLDIFKI
jgi:hypothetical protein